MPKKFSITNNKVFDLEERTAVFGESVIAFSKNITINLINKSLVFQLIKAAGSVGANYMEADGAESKKDFCHKIAICKKEAKECRHWLRLIAKANPEYLYQCRELWREAQELSLIFAAIFNKKKS